MSSLAVNPKRRASGAIPRFPVWEVTILMFSVVTGMNGLLSSPPPMFVIILGSVTAVKIWYLSVFLVGFTGLLALRIPAPNGLITMVVSMVGLALSCGSVVISLAIYSGQLFFPGSTTLWVFFIGAVWRGAQSFSQLTRLRNELQNLNAKRENKEPCELDHLVDGARTLAVDAENHDQEQIADDARNLAENAEQARIHKYDAQ